MRSELVSLLQTMGGTPIWCAEEVAAHAIDGATVSSTFAQLDRELPGQGWPRGQLVELLVSHAGIGELSLLAPALAQLAYSGRTNVWIMPCESVRAPHAHLIPYAPALSAAGVDLAHTIFVEPSTPSEGLWAFEKALRAEHLGAVIGWISVSHRSDNDFKALQRLHVLAQRNLALAFVFRSALDAPAPSPAALRLQLSGTSAHLKIDLLKRRGRPLPDPIFV
ncbi:MAG: translesion DNA synthesis-associated protein ImuA, partial [Burkholderiaceae bacterium]